MSSERIETNEGSANERIELSESRLLVNGGSRVEPCRPLPRPPQRVVVVHTRRYSLEGKRELER